MCGVVQDGELVFARGWGSAHLEHAVPMATDTVFHVASLSKQFTAVTAALVCGERDIPFGTDLRRFVPEIPEGPPITFRHAIHHTSGLREQWDLLRLSGWRDADLKTTGDVLRAVARQGASNFAPGTRFQYINTAYTLVAVALERITGETMRGLSDRLIFAPLGMRDTFFLDDHVEIVPRRAQAYARQDDGSYSICVPHFETVGPSNLQSTLDDLARWEANLIDPVVGDEDLIARMAAPAEFVEGARIEYGYGLILGHHGAYTTLEHAGGDAAFRAYYLRVPDHRLSVIILANFLEISPSQIARQIVDLILPQPDRGAAMSSTAPLDLKLHNVARIDGLYRHDESGVTCEISLRGGQLHLASSGADYELVPLANGNFRVRDMDIEVVFDLSRPGPAQSVAVHVGGNTVNRCARVTATEPTDGAALADFAGTFVSCDLDTDYTVAPRDGLLVVRGPRGLAIRLRPSHRDAFAALDTTIDVQFQRSEDGKVHGFLLSSERAWNIPFTRAG